MSIETSLRDYIVTNYLDGQHEDLTDETPLFDLNIIDSMTIFDFVQFLREETSVEIPIEEVTPENFKDIRSIGQLTRNIRLKRA